MNVLGVIVPMVTLGLVAGIFGGMFGIGGGLIMVPALILVFGFEQKTAFGTSLLAQLMPVAILGVAEYWRRDQVHISAGLWIALGLFVGAGIGGHLTGLIPREPMKQSYGLFLVVIGVYFLIAPSTPTGKAKPSVPPAQPGATAGPAESS